jgi:adenine-specific DNA methylase
MLPANSLKKNSLKESEMTQPKKLIEVAMPIKEISAESLRDKSIRHGHISTLHLWWARRPLPVCRAVVFASLVPDPLDENCPQAFKDAVQLLLGHAFSLKSGNHQ